MSTPTPTQLAQAIADLGVGYRSEVVGLGRPDPLLGEHLAKQAKRVARVDPSDARLAAFAPFTDPTGYVWFPEATHDYLTAPGNRFWSFERWFIGLAESVARSEAPSAEDLTAMASEAAAMVDASRSGFRPVEIHSAGDRAGVLFKRGSYR